VRFGFVSPGGEFPRGDCLPPAVGGNAVRADANGRYTVTSTARVSDPMEVCVQVQAWPAPMVSAPSVTVQAQRMPVSFETVPEQRVDVTLADLP
jgi:hypothetical protein